MTHVKIPYEGDAATNADNIIGVAAETIKQGKVGSVQMESIIQSSKATDLETDNNEVLIPGQDLYVKPNGKVTHSVTPHGKIGTYLRFGFECHSYHKLFHYYLAYTI